MKISGNRRLLGYYTPLPWKRWCSSHEKQQWVLLLLRLLTLK